MPGAEQEAGSDPCIRDIAPTSSPDGMDPALIHRVLEHLSSPRSRQMAPRIGAGVLAGGVVHVPRFGIRDLGQRTSGTAVVRLTLNEAKTSIRRARTERFDFLGYTFGPHHLRKKGV